MTGERKNGPGEEAGLADERPCAVCGRPAAAQYRPFCSKRCADVDLNRWLGEQYRIPTDEPADGEEPPPDA
ncbi:DNA gyrase inhibitor YacG [Hwanghaeella sp.]|uniref:DNA gyrase inhibitor YacG n=1 Tax=Hwanghaeella sp. TaxID=2605943 RepID=UPI003CCBCD65